MGGLAPVVTSAVGLGAPVIGKTLTPLLASGIMKVADMRAEKEARSTDRRNVEAEQQLALRQLQARQQIEQSQSAASAGLEKERLAAASEAADASRRSALRRAVARQRALFGASGIGNAESGSQEAVLLGLFDESADELAERERLDTLRTRALDLSLDSQSAINVLQRTQLQERQRLARAAAF